MFNFLKNSKSVRIEMPFEGEVVDLKTVPDHVFSQKMLGDGFAILPKAGINTICSPCDGELIQIFPTNHAIGIQSKEGVEMIIHVGIDTVELKGEGFERLLEPPCTIKTGQALLNFNSDIITALNKETITPVVFTEMQSIKTIKVHYGILKKGDVVCKITLK
ncbi:PTS sugar transporter subunit IIA [Fusibacter ferrireducens]|uniref:PTS glucose transporter subunit IIA n=1 Tax=Fusibacter ferrireducens TaxID=2785058 RepID=A0ABR9ZTN0_9FIRM|nr:PTS glucose transporter subunit IIA [Fusibacter ferrireducens]MBF4693803.1 PTS glucose transporter subunit IIA [Fusibacter ferrireducens]